MLKIGISNDQPTWNLKTHSTLCNQALIFEAENLCLTARATVEAAQIRIEGHGARYRMDFPDQNDTDWQMNVCFYACEKTVPWKP